MGRDPGLFGDRMMVLGSGPVEVPGAAGGIVALDGRGDTVLVVVLESLRPGSAAAIADRLDEVADLSPRALAPSPPTSDSIEQAHARFFGTAKRKVLNERQRAVVVVEDPPSLQGWRALSIEIGNDLAGVFRRDQGRVIRLDVPDELRRPKARTSTGQLIGAVAALVAVAAAVIAVVAVRRSSTPAAPVSASQADASVRTVVAGAPVGASNNQWIGQQRAARLSSGESVFVFPAPGAIQVVVDHANLGRSWNAVTTLPGMAATSLAVVADGNDNLHVVYGTGTTIEYVMLRRSPKGWSPGEVLELDSDSGGPVVDIAWDTRHEVAHLIWAHATSGREQPYWAAITGGRRPREVARRALAPPGNVQNVLANIAVSPGGYVLATYRKAAESVGWFSRSAPVGDPARMKWEPEQRLTTDAIIGAASIAADGAGRTHLILRDSTTYQLLYFVWSGAAWSAPETAVDGQRTEDLDFPTVSADLTSGLVYVFFQSVERLPGGEIRYVLRDPVAGWQGSFELVRPESIPNGAVFPNSAKTYAGQPLVYWTTGGGAPVLQAALAPLP